MFDKSSILNDATCIHVCEIYNETNEVNTFILAFYNVLYIRSNLNIFFILQILVQVNPFPSLDSYDMSAHCINLTL